MLPSLGIIAGCGELPAHVCAACRVSGREHFVVGIKGSVNSDDLKNSPYKIVRLGAVGDIIAQLKKRGIEEVVMVGSINRPSWEDLRPDFRGLHLLPKLLIGGQGDGNILKLAINEFEEEGFQVIGVEKVLPDLLTPIGLIGNKNPTTDSMKDIRCGVTVGKTIGKLDIGQAVVVQQGMILGVEAVEGTKSLLARCGKLSKKGPRGVLVKIKKPNQDPRADLPTIGPDTIMQLKEAGFCGVALEAKASLIVNRVEVVQLADKFGIFVIGIELNEVGAVRFP